MHDSQVKKKKKKLNPSRTKIRRVNETHFLKLWNINLKEKNITKYLSHKQKQALKIYRKTRNR